MLSFGCCVKFVHKQRDWLKTDEMLEFGFFPDGMRGMQSPVIPKTCSSNRYRFAPLILIEPHEIVPYETGREIMKGLFKAQTEAMKR